MSNVDDPSRRPATPSIYPSINIHHPSTHHHHHYQCHKYPQSLHHSGHCQSIIVGDTDKTGNQDRTGQDRSARKSPKVHGVIPTLRKHPPVVFTSKSLLNRFPDPLLSSPSCFSFYSASLSGTERIGLRNS
ncbi:hypothetical protein GALMADRAFT_227516 [Galerina marginata CBS 339.88]|uniref:Uncharacterized protein n=1 Tax=Galerina marginata (strain CBS 339.88) TaxID=685588 RepID=A0A067SWR4_GALM3|nr:hypothetical protein GALMADRAFT_227516 [Galerina marginata CBS 339.88]